MIPDILQSKVRQVVDDAVAKIQPHFPNEVFRPITIQYENCYSTAGWALSEDNIVIFNSILLLANEEEFLKQIVPHEAAHLITDHIYGYETQPHGKEWKSIMALLGLPGDAHHDLDVSICKRSTTEYTFRCECPDGTEIHTYGSLLRRKILKEKLSCSDCMARLIPVDPVEQPYGMPFKVAAGTKADRAKWIIKKFKTQPRKKLIAKLMKGAGLSKVAAGTYLYNLSKDC